MTGVQTCALPIFHGRAAADSGSAVALHGALNQGLRNRRLMALREGHVQILVATDVAARGLDVPTVTHVFNFGLPMKAEDYTHRIGRTGRAGRDGLAVTLAEQRDRRRIYDIEAYTRQQFKAEVIPGLEPKQRVDSRPPSGFAGRNTRPGGAPRPGVGREGFSYKREGGFNDRFAQRAEPHNDFAPRKPSFAKPGPDRAAHAAPARPASAPRDTLKRAARPARPVR